MYFASKTYDIITDLKYFVSLNFSESKGKNTEDRRLNT